MQSRSFNKPSLSIPQQISLLRQHGLNFLDEKSAFSCLSTVSYHRLSGYFKPFKASGAFNEQFKPGIDFETIWDLYIFDKKLRLLVMDALERIEIAFRTAISNTLSLKYGAWWYLEEHLFKSNWKTINPHLKKSPADIFKDEVNNICHNEKADDGIKHYYKNYDFPKYPPSWTLFESLSFGRSTSLFRYLKHNQDKSEISKVLGFSPNILESALECFRYVRNLCAHHSRLWDRWFVYKPRYLKETAEVQCIPGTLKEQLVLINLFNFKISPDSTWRTHIYSLLDQYQSIPIEPMGFSKQWREDKFWKQQYSQLRS